MPRALILPDPRQFSSYLVFRKGKYHMVNTRLECSFMRLSPLSRRIPIRLYCQWGMVFVTMKGIRRLIFQTIERLVCLLSTMCSRTAELNLGEEGSLKGKSCLIWNGSAKSVDLTGLT